jgi:tetratricopeptide (TPR) repeat protein
LLKSCQTFLKTFPDSSKKQAVMFKAMSLALQTGNTGDGFAYARQILDTPLNHVSAEIIVQTHYLLAKSYFNSQDYNSAESEFKQTLAWSQRADYHNPDGPSPTEVKAYLASILYKRADSLKNQLKWKDAGLAFYHLFEELPESELAPVSLMNSGSAFLEIKDYDAALNSFSKMTTFFPHSTYFLEAESALTSIYEKKGKWNEAAAGYEALISQNTEPDKKNRYADKLYTLYFKDGNWTKLNQNLIDAFKDSSLSNPKWLYYLAVSAKELKQESVTLRAVDKSISLLNKSTLPSHDDEDWIMKSLLLKGGILYNQFVLTTLFTPIEKSLPVKKEKLKEAIDTFSLASQSGNPEIATEALYHIGNLFEQFATDLSRSERPKELTTEQREIYEELLKNQISPLYQKAIEVYQKNLTFSNQVENDWIRRSEARYRQLILENKGTSS